MATHKTGPRALIGIAALAAVAAAAPARALPVYASEDFSGVDPLAGYVAYNVYTGTDFASIRVVDGALRMTESPRGFAAGTVADRDLVPAFHAIFEADVSFETTSRPRSYASVQWSSGFDGGVRIVWGLQLDERAGYFYLITPSKVTRLRVPVPSLEPGRTYRLGLELERDGVVRAFVDDRTLLDQVFDLHEVPAQMHPGFSGNAYGLNGYGSLALTFDNAVVRAVPEPGQGALLLAGLGCIALAGSARAQRRRVVLRRPPG